MTISLELMHIVNSLDLPAEPRQAVDVGCGLGRDVRLLAEHGFTAIGVDANPASIAQATHDAADTPGATFLEGDATKLPVEDNSCVLVTDRGCLHHIPVASRPFYAREVERVLAQGGAWIIREATGHHGQVDELSGEQIRTLMEEAGLSAGDEQTVEAESRHGRHEWVIVVGTKGRKCREF